MHWTDRNIYGMAARVILDFTEQLEDEMDTKKISKSELAKKLNVSCQCVTRFMNGQQNHSVESLVRYAKALGLNVALVTYEKPQDRGPIHPEIFYKCWEKAGKPETFSDLEGAGEE